MWLGADELKAMQKLANEFSKDHPKIRIQYINIVNGGIYGETKLTQMIGGGTAPDVMMLNSGQFETFAQRGALAKLNSLVHRDSFDMGQFWPEAQTGVKYKGAQYAMPKDISNVQYYVNKSLFSKAGVAIPSASWDWGDLQTAAVKLTKALGSGGVQKSWGTVLNDADWNWGPYVWTNGGEIYSGKTPELTKPKAITGLEFFWGLLTNEKAAPSPSDLNTFGAGTTGSTNSFIDNVVGLGLYGPWQRPGLVVANTFDWSVLPIPKGPKGQTSIGPIYTDMWAISATTKHQSEAWTMLKWFSGPTGQKKWIEIFGGRSITPVKKLAESDAWLNYGNHRADNQAILDMLVPKYDRKPPVAFGNGIAAETLWDNEWTLVEAGQESVRQGAQNIAQKLGPLLSVNAHA